ncbi:putative letm1-like protein [Venustampulla echinocandica]|uniref:Putative letm1-like protein n=1 Tax=Venustampulla echinocandica TaxID=2656787 RepID=A0A370TC97_9HELO|nr:putative letm1-like protein [Venustampulla echinocandica]RDL31879.1 putative letm1-like protein [Venustampulla echinocandica]
MTTLAVRGLRTASCLPRPHSAVLLSFKQRQLPSSPSPSQLFLRPASTASTQSKPSSPQPQPSSGTINGPLSTLPAPLNLPVKPETTNFSYYLSLGKAYALFYRTGAKNIFTNFRASQPIQAIVDKKYKGSVPAAVSAGALTRSDFQLLNRSWHDIKRLPIFGLVFIVCGEFTPLVVIALSNVVPWTCRIPKQVESDRRKLEKRRGISFRNLTAEPPKQKGVEALERMQLLHISWSVGLSSRVWDWVGGQLPGLPDFILRKRVKNWVEYLEMDDGLIGKPSRVDEMDLEEVKMALVQRGVDVLEKDESQLRVDLVSWLNSRKKAPIERLLLTRPSVWPSKPKSPSI